MSDGTGTIGELVEFEVAKPQEPWKEIFCEMREGGRRYWRKNGALWCCDGVEDLKRWLRSKGLLASVTKEEYAAGETVSEVDRAILNIQEKNKVHFAGPYAGWKTGVHSISGRQVLVTEELPIPKPKAPGDHQPKLPEGEEVFFAGKCHGWPNIGQILNSRLRGECLKSRPQVETFLTVLQRAYSALQNGRPKRCQAMVFAGDTSAGKSLLIDAVIKPIMGDRAAYPLRYMLGTTEFNSDLHKAALWKIDDEATKTKIHERKHLAAKVKQAVAVKGDSMHGKGSEAVEIETQNLLIFATNLEEQNLLVLPPLDNDVEGKIHLFKYHSAEWPCWPLDPRAEEEINAKILRDEIPYFLHWLLNEFEVPDEIWESRFGAKSFYHEEILEKLDFLSHEVKFYNLIERTLLKRVGDVTPPQWNTWEGSAAELYEELKEDPSISHFDKDHLPDPNPTIGKYLSKLQTRPSYAGCIERKRTHAGRVWSLVSRDAITAKKEASEAEEGAQL